MAKPKKIRRDDTAAPRRRPMPTTALPGSAEKVAEMRRRFRLGLDLTSPEDVTEDEERGRLAASQRNGAPCPRGREMRVVNEKERAGRRDGFEAAAPRRPSVGLGRRVRELRRRRGWGLKKLAKEAGAYKSTISRIENGVRAPSASVLAAIARALGVTADFLLGLEKAG